MQTLEVGVISTGERAETLRDLVTCPRQSWNLNANGSDSKTHCFTRKLTSSTQGRCVVKLVPDGTSFTKGFK